MTDDQTIRKFEYRPCRFTAGIKVEFVKEGETIHGLCRDVSDTGIRAWLDGSVELGSCGILTLRHPNGVLDLEAQVAYFNEGQVGLSFVLETEWDRNRTKDYIASIATSTGPSQVFRFP